MPTEEQYNQWIALAEQGNQAMARWLIKFLLEDLRNGEPIPQPLQRYFATCLSERTWGQEADPLEEQPVLKILEAVIHYTQETGVSRNRAFDDLSQDFSSQLAAHKYRLGYGVVHIKKTFNKYVHYYAPIFHPAWYAAQTWENRSLGEVRE